MFSFTEKKDYSCLCMWTTQNWLEETEYQSDVESTHERRVLMKDVDLGEPTSFLDHVSLGNTQRECKITKENVENYKLEFVHNCSETSVFGSYWET